MKKSWKKNQQRLKIKNGVVWTKAYLCVKVVQFKSSPQPKRYSVVSLAEKWSQKLYFQSLDCICQYMLEFAPALWKMQKQGQGMLQGSVYAFTFNMKVSHLNTVIFKCRMLNDVTFTLHRWAFPQLSGITLPERSWEALWNKKAIKVMGGSSSSQRASSNNTQSKHTYMFCQEKKVENTLGSGQYETTWTPDFF